MTGYYQFTATMNDVSNMGVVIMRDDDVVSAMGYEKNEGHISANTIIACLTGQRVYVQVRAMDIGFILIVRNEKKVSFKREV